MNEKEFAGIVKSTKSIVLSAIKKHMPAQYFHSIDDVVQETYLRAYKSLIKNSFRGDSSVETWLYTIARNESLRMTKKLNREEIKQKRKAEKMDELAMQNESDGRETISGLKIDMERVLNTMPEKYKSVMKLLSLGFSEKQIAHDLSLKSGTVKSRIFRGKALLRKIIGGAKNDC